MNDLQMKIRGFQSELDEIAVASDRAVELYEPPRGAVEEALAELWRDVLQLEQVRRHDNFFQLGGHSLSMTRLVWKIADRFQVEPPLRQAFRTPVLHQMARHLEGMLPRNGPEPDAGSSELEDGVI